MPSDSIPSLEQVTYTHTQRATPYHSSVVSFRIGPDRQGRQIYARATHRRLGICVLDFHYLDNDTGVLGRSVYFGIFPTFGPRRTPATPLGADVDGNIPQYHYLNTYRSHVICDLASKEVLARIDFHPTINSTATGFSQAEGAIVEPKELVFVSKWDDPVVNLTCEQIEEDYTNGIIHVEVDVAKFYKGCVRRS